MCTLMGLHMLIMSHLSTWIWNNTPPPSHPITLSSQDSSHMGILLYEVDLNHHFHPHWPPYPGPQPLDRREILYQVVQNCLTLLANHFTVKNAIKMNIKCSWALWTPEFYSIFYSLCLCCFTRRKTLQFIMIVLVLPVCGKDLQFGTVKTRPCKVFIKMNI